MGFLRSRVLLAGGAIFGILGFFFTQRTIIPKIPRAFPLVFQEIPTPQHNPWKEGILLPPVPCDPLIWISLDFQRITGERLLCTVRSKTFWESRIRTVWGDSVLYPVEIRQDGWRLGPRITWKIPTSSPRPLYVRIFWIAAFGVLFWGVARRVSIWRFRESIPWAVLWGVLSVANRLQLLPLLRGLITVERRNPVGMTEIFFHGPYWAVLLLQILVIWLALGITLERLSKSSPFLTQEFLSFFRFGGIPRRIAQSMLMGLIFAGLWWGVMAPIVWVGGGHLRTFVDPFILGGWLPGLHLLHRAFEMAFTALGLWLITNAWKGRVPMGMVWGGLGLLGVGPLFPFPFAYTTVLDLLLRLTVGGASALAFGFVLQSQGALTAFFFALFAWMMPSSALLSTLGLFGVIQLILAWGIPLIVGTWILWKGVPDRPSPKIPRCSPQDLERLLENPLDRQTFQSFLYEKGWGDRPLWWHLTLLCEEIYGIPVDLEVSQKEIRIRIPPIRMVQDGVRRILGVQGEEKDGQILYRFPRDDI